MLISNLDSICVPLWQAFMTVLCQYPVVRIHPPPTSLSKGVTANLKPGDNIVLQWINVSFYLQVRKVRCKLFKITQKLLKTAARITLDLHGNQSISLSQA